MSKFEDDVMELIETMVENRHHNAAKLIKKGAMPKRQLINAKSVLDGHTIRKNQGDDRGLEPSTTLTEHLKQF